MLNSEIHTIKKVSLHPSIINDYANSYLLIFACSVLARGLLLPFSLETWTSKTITARKEKCCRKLSDNGRFEQSTSGESESSWNRVAKNWTS